MMDLPLRVRLLGAFVGIVVFSGALTILAGSFLIKRMVISEGERRVVLGLKTARAMWKRRLDEALKASLVMAQGDNGAGRLSFSQAVDSQTLDELRTRLGYDFLHILDDRGTMLVPASGDQTGAPVSNSPVIARVIQTRKPAAGISLLPMEDLTTTPQRGGL